ncbi:hypothetical protein L6164_026895 [Bauhinia variegata]|uniref:Uncharacterized protein n=1 Tax=Bauhinia variegata TaxID=167791 RepID=A0ACB9LS83_BAUVA|nr:hypothetical protein L6164_026895 [Bauhinia variegata]
MNSDSSVPFESEKDDDIFYAEIRKQILLLTSEEDNEVFLESKQFNPIRVGNSGPKRSNYGFPNASIPASRFCYWESENSGSPPVWLVNLWKNGKGTRVFIPLTVKCIRNYRTGTGSSLLIQLRACLDTIAVSKNSIFTDVEFLTLQEKRIAAEKYTRSVENE